MEQQEEQLANVLGVKRVDKHEGYIGLPTSKIEAWLGDGSLVYYELLFGSTEYVL